LRTVGLHHCVAHWQLVSLGLVVQLESPLPKGRRPGDLPAEELAHEGEEPGRPEAPLLGRDLF